MNVYITTSPDTLSLYFQKRKIRKLTITNLKHRNRFGLMSMITFISGFASLAYPVVTVRYVYIPSKELKIAIKMNIIDFFIVPPTIVLMG